MNPIKVEYLIVYRLKGDKYSNIFTCSDAHDYESVVSRAQKWAERKDIDYIKVEKTTILSEVCLIIKE